MKKFKKPKEIEGKIVLKLYPICFTVLEGYLGKKPMRPSTDDGFTVKLKRDELSKIFRKFETDQKLHEKFCNACDTQNLAIPFK